MEKDVSVTNHRKDEKTNLHPRLSHQTPSDSPHHREHQEDEGGGGGGRGFVAEVIGAAPAIGQTIVLRKVNIQYSHLKYSIFIYFF